MLTFTGEFFSYVEQNITTSSETTFLGDRNICMISGEKLDIHNFQDYLDSLYIVNIDRFKIHKSHCILYL